MANFGGTNGDDTITGSSSADRINASGGNDTVYAGAGADLVYGGEGNDYVDGGSGADTIYGGTGDDSMLGREGADVFAFIFGLTDLAGNTVSRAEGNTSINEVKIASSEGHDIILDFDHRLATSDKLQFRFMTEDQYDYLVSSGQLTSTFGDFTGDGNTDMKISWDGGSIALSGITQSKIADLSVLSDYILFN